MASQNFRIVLRNSKTATLSSIEISSTPASAALAKHRERLRSRGLQRLEVQVRGEDTPLLRAVAAALADPRQAPEARALLLRRFIPAPARRLKGLI